MRKREDNTLNIYGLAHDHYAVTFRPETLARSSLEVDYLRLNVDLLTYCAGCIGRLDDDDHGLEKEVLVHKVLSKLCKHLQLSNGIVKSVSAALPTYSIR